MIQWQLELPNSIGNWLWIITYSCGCCICQSGIAYVYKKESDKDYLDNVNIISLNNKYYLSWENQIPNKQNINDITAWCKIELPNFELIKDKLFV